MRVPATPASAAPVVATTTVAGVQLVGDREMRAPPSNWL